MTQFLPKSGYIEWKWKRNRAPADRRRFGFFICFACFFSCCRYEIVSETALSIDSSVLVYMYTICMKIFESPVASYIVMMI